jgi:hypothetical protein
MHTIGFDCISDAFLNKYFETRSGMITCRKDTFFKEPVNIHTDWVWLIALKTTKAGAFVTNIGGFVSYRSPGVVRTLEDLHILFKA